MNSKAINFFLFTICEQINTSLYANKYICYLLLMLTLVLPLFFKKCRREREKETHTRFDDLYAYFDLKTFVLFDLLC